MENNAPLYILGGRSLPAPFLMDRLRAAGQTATVISRQELPLPQGFTLLPMDINKTQTWHAPQGAIILSLLPIWILSAHLPLFENASAIIAVSSTSRFGKKSSDDPHEQEVVHWLEEGETTLENWAKAKAINYTILRPTLIYDGDRDQNITRIKHMISRFGTFPIAAPGNGLRQPIHADDVAGAIMGAIGNNAAHGQAFNIAGGEILTYRQMVEKVFLSMGRHPRPLMLPLWLLKTAFRVARALHLIKEHHFGLAVFQRMNEDLVFEHKAGLTVLNYNPRKFL